MVSSNGIGTFDRIFDAAALASPGKAVAPPAVAQDAAAAADAVYMDIGLPSIR